MSEQHRVWGRMGGRPKGRFKKHPRLVPERVESTGLHSGRVSIQLPAEEWALVMREASKVKRHCGRLQVGKILSVLVSQGIERMRERYGDQAVEAAINGQPSPIWQEHEYDKRLWEQAHGSEH